VFVAVKFTAVIFMLLIEPVTTAGDIETEPIPVGLNCMSAFNPLEIKFPKFMMEVNVAVPVPVVVIPLVTILPNSSTTNPGLIKPDCDSKGL
jgi:hypothetical protein